MRIGILTYHRSINYGAFIQAYALQNFLKKSIGYDVEIIDFDTAISEKYYKDYLSNRYKRIVYRNIYYYKKRSNEEITFAKQQRESFEKARNNYLLLSSKSLVSNDLLEFREFIQGNYDIIIVGSDEVWRVNGMRGFPNPYWLPTINNCIKVSYAASSRESFSGLSTFQKDKIKEYLMSFDYISVRDRCTQNLINEITGDERANLVCDPTMAYDFEFDKERGKKLLKEYFGISFDKPIIGLMDEFGRLSDYVIKKYNDSIQIVPLYKYVKGVNNYGAINPLEWVDIISSLDGLLTSFFHGMCISINTNTPFRVFEHRNVKDPLYSKSYDLLSKYNCDNLYVQMSKGHSFQKVVDDFISKILNGKMNEDYSHIKMQEQRLADGFIKILLKYVTRGSNR